MADVEITAGLLAEVQDYFGLPSPALVEKDWWVVKALEAITAVELPDHIHLVFGGGTALGRAHRLIRRMSEDIDLKIVSNNPLTRAQLGQIRQLVTQALLHAGFKFDPGSEEHLISRSERRFTQFKLPYPSVLDEAKTGLRPSIQVELTASRLLLPPVTSPVSSFVAEALGMEPEIAAIACVSVEQTAAEKFVALTRRIGEELVRDMDRDDTLLRHVYDLHITWPRHDQSKMTTLVPVVMQEDAQTFGQRYPQYASNPSAETLRILAVIRTDGSYGLRFREFHDLMVYGDRVEFLEALATLDLIASRSIAKD